MNNFKISLRNLLHKPLYAFLAVFSLAISIGLLIGIQQLDASVKNQFENGLGGSIDMVVGGAKGSPLQLVLSSVLHIDNPPTGNIDYAEAKRIEKNPLVKKAVPISYGDNLKGYRIVGSTQDFKTFYGAEILEGKEATTSMEAVLGSEVAEKLGLKLGDTFLSSHGLTENTIEEHDEEFEVVGIYKPTFKVIDRLIVTPLSSIWDVHAHHGKEHEDHSDRGHEEENENHHDHDHDFHDHEEDGHEDHEHEKGAKEVTSLLVSFRNPMGYITLSRSINEDTDMQAAMPKFELDRLFNFTGIGGVKVVSWIAYIILLISCLTIFIGLYKMVRERAFDLA